MQQDMAGRGRRRPGRVIVAVVVVTLASVGGFILALRLTDPDDTPWAKAEKLHEEGKHDAAIALLRQALTAKGDADPAPEIRAGLARCRLDVTRTLIDERRFEEAKALMQRARSDVTPKSAEEGQIIWELAVSKACAGDPAGALETLWEYDEHAEARVLESWTFSFTARGQGAVDKLERMAPAVLDDEDPRHAFASLYLARSIGHPSFDSATEQWLSAQAEKISPMLLAVFPMLQHISPELREFSLMDDMTDYVEYFSGEDIETRLAEMAQDEQLPEDIRAHATQWLAMAADLPVRIKRDIDGPTFDEPTISKVVTLWQTGRSLPRTERFRRNVQSGIAQLAEDDHWEIKEWLEEHTGVEKDWDFWWLVNSKDDPRHWLRRPLDLSEETDTHEVLELFLRSDKPRRVWLHHLLALMTDESITPPVWPPDVAWSRGEPEGLPMAWYIKLVDMATERPHLLRVVVFELRNGDPEPILLSEKTAPMRVGESIKMIHELPNEATWPIRRRQFRSTLGGFNVAGPGPRETLTTVGKLEWKSYGLFLDMVGGREAAPGIVTYADGPREGDHKRPGNTGDDWNTVTRLILAVAQPPGSSSVAWTTDDWRRHVASNFTLLANGAEQAAETGDDRFRRRHHDSTWRLPEIASYLAVPEAAEAMARLHAALELLGKPTSFSTDVPGRLLAGDATVLDDPLFERRFKEGVGVSGLGNGFWCRVLLTARDARIQELAASRIYVPEPSRIAITLERAIKEGRVQVPDPLAQKVSGAESRLRWLKIRDMSGRLVIAVSLYAMAILAVVFALWPGRPLHRRLRPATLLLVVGIIFACLQIYGEGVDLIPDVAGHALACVGTAILSRTAKGVARHVALIGFAAAAVSSGLAMLGIAVEPLLFVAGVSFVVAVAAVPLLARALDPRPGPHPIWRLALFYIGFVGPIGLGLILWFAGRLTGRDLSIELSEWQSAALVGVMAVCVIAALVVLLRSVRRARAAAISASPT